MEEQKTIICPFCFAHVVWGASVCRGCHAVLVYGASRKWYFCAFALSLFVGAWLTRFFEGWFLLFPAVIVLICFAFLSYKLGEKFQKKVIFRRHR
jgi:hypothetical protein